MNSCQEIREELVLYAEGALDETRNSAIRGHIRGCEECRHELAALSQVTDWLRDPGVFAPQEDLRWQLLPEKMAARVRGPESPRRWIPTNFGRLTWALGMAATFVLACGIVWITRSVPVKPPQVAAVAPRAEAPENGVFLEKIQGAYARQVTSRYLEECRDLLLSVVRSGPTCPDEKLDVSVEVERAKELLQRKRWLDAELNRPEVAQARALCDEIETLLVSLSAASECETRDRMWHMERLIERQRLLLRISVVQAELS